MEFLLKMSFFYFAKKRQKNKPLSMPRIRNERKGLRIRKFLCDSCVKLRNLAVKN